MGDEGREAEEGPNHDQERKKSGMPVDTVDIVDKLRSDVAEGQKCLPFDPPLKNPDSVYRQPHRQIVRGSRKRHTKANSRDVY